MNNSQRFWKWLGTKCAAERWKQKNWMALHSFHAKTEKLTCTQKQGSESWDQKIFQPSLHCEGVQVYKKVTLKIPENVSVSETFISASKHSWLSVDFDDVAWSPTENMFGCGLRTSVQKYTLQENIQRKRYQGLYQQQPRYTWILYSQKSCCSLWTEHSCDYRLSFQICMTEKLKQIGVHQTVICSSGWRLLLKHFRVEFSF